MGHDHHHHHHRHHSHSKHSTHKASSESGLTLASATSSSLTSVPSLTALPSPPSALDALELGHPVKPEDRLHPCLCFASRFPNCIATRYCVPVVAIELIAFSIPAFCFLMAINLFHLGQPLFGWPPNVGPHVPNHIMEYLDHLVLSYQLMLGLFALASLLAAVALVLSIVYRIAGGCIIHATLLILGLICNWASTGILTYLIQEKRIKLQNVIRVNSASILTATLRYLDEHKQDYSVGTLVLSIILTPVCFYFAFLSTLLLFEIRRKLVEERLAPAAGTNAPILSTAVLEQDPSLLSLGVSRSSVKRTKIVVNPRHGPSSPHLPPPPDKGPRQSILKKAGVPGIPKADSQ